MKSEYFIGRVIRYYRSHLMVLLGEFLVHPIFHHIQQHGRLNPSFDCLQKVGKSRRDDEPRLILQSREY